MRVGGGNITTYSKLILDDMNSVQRDKAYKREDIIPSRRIESSGRPLVTACSRRFTCIMYNMFFICVEICLSKHMIYTIYVFNLTTQ